MLFKDGLLSGSTWRTSLRRCTDSQEMGPDCCTLHQQARTLTFICVFVVVEIAIFKNNNRKEVTQFQISVAWNRGADASENSLPTKAQMYRINRIVNHPSYDPSKSKVANDIALINLLQEAAWNDMVKPICLPDADENSFTGTTATVAGWGHDKSGIIFSNIF